jgi:hypothetical protein
MLRQAIECWSLWYRKNHNYLLSRKISDYRATSIAEKLISTGALQSTRLTGSPLLRDQQ